MNSSIDQQLLQFSYVIGLFAFMNSKWVWPIIESLHYIGLTLLIGTVGAFDLRLLGIGKGLSYQMLHKFVPLGIFGYCLNVITGTLFFLAAPAQYLYNPAFQLKMVFMICAQINMLVFYASTFNTVKSVPDDRTVVVRAKVIAFLSLVCWTSVIICGRLITFFRPPYHWCVWC